MLIQTMAKGAATASDEGHAPIALFWVRITTSCINIKRGVQLTIVDHWVILPGTQDVFHAKVIMEH